MPATRVTLQRIAVIALLLIMAGTLLDTIEPDAARSGAKSPRKRSTPQRSENVIAQPVSCSLFPTLCPCLLLT